MAENFLEREVFAPFGVEDSRKANFIGRSHSREKKVSHTIRREEFARQFAAKSLTVRKSMLGNIGTVRCEKLTTKLNGRRLNCS